MLQRNITITKSVLDKFWIGNSRLSKNTSSWTPLHSPTSAAANSASYSSSSATFDNSYQDESFESFMTRTDSDTGLSHTGHLSNAIDNQIVSEYTVLNDSSLRYGLATLKRGDATDLMLEFDMDATISLPRDFKGVKGAHKWRAYEAMHLPDKIDIKIGDDVVVIGISKRGKIHIIDPAFNTSNV